MIAMRDPRFVNAIAAVLTGTLEHLAKDDPQVIDKIFDAAKESLEGSSSAADIEDARQVIDAWRDEITGRPEYSSNP